MKEDTNYTKGKMEATIQELGSNITHYNSINTSLENAIGTVEQNWVEGDPTAMQLLGNLKTEYKGFKATSDEMEAMMNEMKANIQSQVERYQGAESKISQLF